MTLAGTSVSDAEDLPWQLELDRQAVLTRLDWARRQGHPQYQWPEVPPGQWRAALRRVEGVVRSVLGSEPAELNAADPSHARALGVAAHSAGMGPLLGFWIETGRLSADPLLRRLFSLHLDHGRARAARLASELRRCGHALVDAGVRPLVVKSSHTAVEYFPEPGTRPAIDVDVVVEPAEFERAEAALEGAGFTVGAREMRPRKTTWLAPSSSTVPRSLELLHADSQYVVDLHDSLERNFFGVRAIRPTRLDRMTGLPAPELGAQVRVLGQPELLVYHALHASEGLYNLTLVRLVELILMIRRDTHRDTLDWDELWALLHARGASRFCYPALTMAERLAPGTVDSRVLELVADSATPTMRRVLSTRSPADAQRLESLSIEESFMWCATPGEYVRRLLHMIVPAPAGLSIRRLAGQYRERLYRLLRRTVTLRRPPGP